MDAERAKPAAAQIGDQHEFTREFPTTPQHAHRVFLTEVMKRQRAEDGIVRFGRVPFQDVSFNESDFRIANTESLRDLNGRGLSIQSIDPQFNANLTSVLCDQSRNIARAGRK